MAEDHDSRIEQMEKVQQELREQLVKAQEESREQFNMLMQMMIQQKEATGGKSVRTQEVTPQESTDPIYPPGFTPTRNPVVFPPPPTYPYPTAPRFVGQTSNQTPIVPNIGASPTNPMEVPDLDDPKEQEKLQKNSCALPESSETQQKYEQLEERLRAIEKADITGPIDLTELSLTPGLVIPRKFKVPDFEKYEGSTCPLTHLQMYCRKMEGHGADEKLLIHFFQDSLTGPAARWFVRLDRKHAQTWKDLARAFMDQYKHVLEMAPDRRSLQNMEKKTDETFREYAQRWRETAAQVQPPLTDREMTTFFVDTFQNTPYYNTMIACASKSFTDMMITGEMVENAIKNGKVGADFNSYSKKGQNLKKKDGETQAVFFGRKQLPAYTFAPTYQRSVNNVGPNAPLYTQRQRIPSNQASNQNNHDWKQRTSRERARFDPIPVTYTELLPRLLENHLVAKVPLKPLEPPYPRWYDPNAQCDYHYGAPGHSTDNCTALKYKVQALIKNGLLNFSNPSRPNVTKNPLPNHTGTQINAVEDICIQKKIDEVKKPLKDIYKALFQNGFLLKGKDQTHQAQDGYDFQYPHCEYHGIDAKHDIQSCPEFRNMVQELMDKKEIEFSENVSYESVNVIIGIECFGEPSGEKLRPLTILYEDDEKTDNTKYEVIMPKLIVEVPSRHPYKSDKAVPWNYDYNYFMETAAVDLSGVGGMTRSGRIYSPAIAEKATQRINTEQVSNKRLSGEKEMTNLQEPPMRQVTERESNEFLKFIKHSEYNVVEQLNKMPARISLLSLLLNSEAHRNALLRVLNEAYVSHNITVDKVDQLVGNIMVSNFIAFSDDEIPPEGRGNTKALYITVKCKGYTLPRALIDNGSSLNVLPMSVLSRLPVDWSYMKKSHIIVRAFDGTKREVIGNIELPIEIGPCTFNIEFQVMDINPSYNCLLGRPWIHMAGAVPSTLHQKVKFVVEDKLITVVAEDDMIAAIATSAPYVELDDNAVESSFQALEMVNAAFVGENANPPSPKLSKTTKMSLKQVLGRGVKPGFGLGKSLQGIIRAMTVVFKPDRYGLGYKPTNIDRRRQEKMKKEKRMCRLEGREENEEPMVVPLLCKSFRSYGFEHSIPRPDSEEMVHMVFTDQTDDVRLAIRLCPPEHKLNNWTATDLAVVYKKSQK